MAVNEEINVKQMDVQNGGTLKTARAASSVCLIAGIWLFVSPWVFGNLMTATSWNCWIVGAFVVAWAIARMARPAYTTILSYSNMFLGIWVFCSPWIYGYAHTEDGHFISSLCVGVIVVVFSIVSATISGAWSPGRNRVYTNDKSRPAAYR